MTSKRKRGNKWIWITLILILLPLILFIIGVVVIFMAFLLIFSEDDSNQLSEYGEGVIPAEFIPIYQEAGEIYGVDWILLASIHKIETEFSTIEPMVSYAGAEGHMQFMPCTWVGWSYPACSGTNGNASIPNNIKYNPSEIARYGGYGVDADGDRKADPFNIHDAIHAAAKYLSANMRGSTPEQRIKNAIRAYNNAEWYVNEVLAYYQMFSTAGFTDFVEIKGDTAWPVPSSKTITSHFNPNRIHPILGVPRPHNGIDISSPAGKPVVAFADGIVTYSQNSQGGYGNLVVIQHSGGVETYYAHLLYQGVPAGTKVRAGQVIGYVGSSGLSTGPHLHFEIRIGGKPVDPMPFLQPFM